MSNATSFEDLTLSLAAEPDERRSVSELQHKADHAFLAEIRPHLLEWLEAEKRRQARHDALMNTIVGGVAVIFLGWLGTKVIGIFSKGLYCG